MSRSKTPPAAPPALLPAPKPPPSAECLAEKAETSRRLAELVKIVTETNLLRTRRLVEMALRGQAPAELVQHFSMIGRDWYDLAENGPQKPEFRVIEGGAS